MHYHEETKKNVLIISKDALEFSTESVMDWIFSLGHACYRLNGDNFEDYNKHVLIDSINKQITIDGINIPTNYYSIWYRRWSDNSFIDNVVELGLENKMNAGLLRRLTNNMAGDSWAVMSGVMCFFKAKKKLTLLTQSYVAKLNVLVEAKKQKIKVPEFILTTRKSDVIDFYKKNNGQIIIKDLDYPFSYSDEAVRYSSFAEIIDEKRLREFPDNFHLSFFQQYVEKEYEIRTFFFRKKMYSMAIFSQKDDKTKIDFRRYNLKHPNRTVPYKLPVLLEKKLRKLMLALNLETGSIDIIKGSTGEYYFLEVNPVGQFGMVSDQCNYHLELEIAKYLIE